MARPGTSRRVAGVASGARGPARGGRRGRPPAHRRCPESEGDLVAAVTLPGGRPGAVGRTGRSPPVAARVAPARGRLHPLSDTACRSACRASATFAPGCGRMRRASGSGAGRRRRAGLRARPGAERLVAGCASARARRWSRPRVERAVRRGGGFGEPPGEGRSTARRDGPGGSAARRLPDDPSGPIGGHGLSARARHVSRPRARGPVRRSRRAILARRAIGAVRSPCP